MSSFRASCQLFKGQTKNTDCYPAACRQTQPAAPGDGGEPVLHVPVHQGRQVQRLGLGHPAELQCLHQGTDQPAAHVFLLFQIR